MKRIYNIILILTIFLIFPSYALASCEDEKDNFIINRDYTMTSEYDKATDSYLITIVIKDNTKHGMVFDGADALKNSTTKVEGKTKTITIKNYKQKEYTAIFISNTQACKGTVLRTDTIEASKPNKYAGSKLCEGYEDFILCQKEYDKEIDEETFKSRLELYKAEKNNDEPVETPKENNDDNEENNINKSFIDKIVDYIKANMFQVIVITVFVIAMIITIIVSVRSAIQSRRLE